MFNRFLIVTVGLIFLAAQFALGEGNPDWRAWRGPLGNGSTEDGTYPVKFGASKYLWRTELPGRGCSTPILVEDTIYLTAPVQGNDALLCYDFQGAEKWRTVFGKENAGKHRNGSGSNASPVTDGKGVFVFFKSGTFAAVEFTGKVRSTPSPATIRRTVNISRVPDPRRAITMPLKI